LLPFLIHNSPYISSFSLRYRCSQPLIQLNSNTIELHITIITIIGTVKIVIRYPFPLHPFHFLNFSSHSGPPSSASELRLDPVDDVIRSGVSYDDALFLLEPLFGPPGTFPFCQTRNFTVCQAQIVKSTEQTPVPCIS
jgi:hypothetical protein